MSNIIILKWPMGSILLFPFLGLNFACHFPHFLPNIIPHNFFVYISFLACKKWATFLTKMFGKILSIFHLIFGHFSVIWSLQKWHQTGHWFDHKCWHQMDLCLIGINFQFLSRLCDTEEQVIKNILNKLNKYLNLIKKSSFCL